MWRPAFGPRAWPSLTLALSLLGAASCGEGNPGIDPPSDRFVFPSGLLLDPRVPSESTGPCEQLADCDADQVCAAGQCRASARWLMVTNANSDLRYNAGSLVAVDLDAFWAALAGEIQPADTKVDRQRPCRRVANMPQVIECAEEPFVLDEATVHFGNFPGPAAAWDRDPADDEAMVLVPVRGDPSVTYLEVSGGLDGSDDLRFECGQASDEDGARRCDDRYRLRYLRNDEDSERIGREPFRIHVSPQADLPYAYVSHQRHYEMSLIALEGLSVGGDGRPAIVHTPDFFVTGNGYDGAFGLAQRPCDVDAGNAPTATLGCTRPLIYASWRWITRVDVVTVVRHEPLEGQTCVGPEDFDKEGGITCEPQGEPLRPVNFNGLSTQGVPAFSLGRPLLADIAFTNDGDELYVVQSNPGGLVRVDTSLDEDNEPHDISVAQVEVCAQPTSLVIYDDGTSRFGLVTCYRTAEVFIVDLTSLTVAGLVRAGTGPDALTVDLAREVVYVANSLDATISVIDMSPTRTTRFTELARLGLQEPYSG